MQIEKELDGRKGKRGEEKDKGNGEEKIRMQRCGISEDIFLLSWVSYWNLFFGLCKSLFLRLHNLLNAQLQIKKVKYKPTFFTPVNRVKTWKWPPVKWKWHPRHSAFSGNMLLVLFRYFWEHWEGTHSPSHPLLWQGSCTVDGIWLWATLLTFLLPLPFIGFFISTLCVLLPSTVWRHGEGTSSSLQLDFSITCKLLISRRYNVDIKLSWLAGEESKLCRYNPVIGKTEHNNCSPYF